MAGDVIVPATGPMRVVPSVITMHEKVQERTGQEQEVRHDAEHVCTVLGEQEEGRDDEEPEQGYPGRQQTVHRSTHLRVSARTIGLRLAHSSAMRLDVA